MSQRCKKGFFHYRALDLCYSFNPLIVADQENIMNACVGPGMEMIRIDSEEKQKYIHETLSKKNLHTPFKDVKLMFLKCY